MYKMTLLGDLLIHGICFTDIMFRSIKHIYRQAVECIERFCQDSESFELMYAGSLEDGLYLPYYSASESGGTENISTDVDLLLIYKSLTVLSDTCDPSSDETECKYWIYPSKYPGYFHLISKKIDINDVKLDPTIIAKHSLSRTAVMNTIQDTVTDTPGSNFLFKSKPHRDGPSIQFKSMMGSGGMLQSVDCVACVRCPFWPSCANSFFSRIRNCGFPKTDIISEIQENGCQFVPVGYPDSDFNEFEWRLSSVIAEKTIIATMSNKQKLAYRIAKALIKTNKHTEELKSYHIKTVLFWLCEERSSEDWELTEDIDNIGLILRRLQTAYNQRSLPNYFVVENNMIGTFSESELSDIALGIENILQSVFSNLIRLLKSIKIMPIASILPVSMETTNLSLQEMNLDSLFYFCANMCLCSLTYHFLSEVDEFHIRTHKTHVYFNISVEIFYHLYTSTSHERQRISLSSNEELSISNILNLYEEILKYTVHAEFKSDIRSDLCISLLNVSSTILSGYLHVTKVTQESVSPYIKCIDFSASMHNKYANDFMTEIMRKYPEYNIESPKNPTEQELSNFLWLKLFVLLLIKYQREKFYLFGRIGDGMADSMALPMNIRHLILTLVYFDYDKTWILLQINRALFCERSILSYLSVMQPVTHDNVETEINGKINLKRLILRAKKGQNSWEDMWQLANLYHSRGSLEKDPKNREAYFNKAQENFRNIEAVSDCIPSIWKVDYALLTLKMVNLRKTFSLLTDVIIDNKTTKAKLSYDRSTIPIVCVPHEFQIGKEYYGIDIAGRIILGVSYFDLDGSHLAYLLDLCRHCVDLYQQLEDKSIDSQHIIRELTAYLLHESNVTSTVEILYHRCDTIL